LDGMLIELVASTGFLKDTTMNLLKYGQLVLQKTRQIFMNHLKRAMVVLVMVVTGTVLFIIGLET